MQDLGRQAGVARPCWGGCIWPQNRSCRSGESCWQVTASSRVMSSGKGCSACALLQPDSLWEVPGVGVGLCTQHAVLKQTVRTHTIGSAKACT